MVIKVCNAATWPRGLGNTTGNGTDGRPASIFAGLFVYPLLKVALPWISFQMKTYHKELFLE